MFPLLSSPFFCVLFVCFYFIEFPHVLSSPPSSSPCLFPLFSLSSLLSSFISSCLLSSFLVSSPLTFAPLSVPFLLFHQMFLSPFLMLPLHLSPSCSFSSFPSFPFCFFTSISSDFLAFLCPLSSCLLSSPLPFSPLYFVFTCLPIHLTNVLPGQ